MKADKVLFIVCRKNAWKDRFWLTLIHRCLFLEISCKIHWHIECLGNFPWNFTWGHIAHPLEHWTSNLNYKVQIPGPKINWSMEHCFRSVCLVCHCTNVNLACNFWSIRVQCSYLVCIFFWSQAFSDNINIHTTFDLKKPLWGHGVLQKHHSCHICFTNLSADCHISMFIHTHLYICRRQFATEGLLPRKHIHTEPFPGNQPCTVQCQWLAESVSGKPHHKSCHPGPAGLKEVSWFPFNITLIKYKRNQIWEHLGK